MMTDYETSFSLLPYDISTTSFQLAFDWTGSLPHFDDEMRANPRFTRSILCTPLETMEILFKRPFSGARV